MYACHTESGPQNNPNMAVLGQNRPLREIFQKFSMKVQQRTPIDVFCPNVMLICLLYKEKTTSLYPLKKYPFFVAILRPFGPARQNLNTCEIWVRSTYVCEILFGSVEVVIREKLILSNYILRSRIIIVAAQPISRFCYHNAGNEMHGFSLIRQFPWSSTNFAISTNLYFKILFSFLAYPDLLFIQSDHNDKNRLCNAHLLYFWQCCNLVICCTTIRKLHLRKPWQKSPWRSLKVNRNDGAI